MTFWDACHSLCFPDNCGECDDFKTNAELIAEGDAIKAPLANLPYTLADVSVVSGASFTRIALDPSPPSTPPSPPPSASPSPPPSSPMVTEWKVYYDKWVAGGVPPRLCSHGFCVL